MSTYVHTGASVANLLDPAKNAGVRIATVDMRSGATLASALNAIAAEFPTTDYPVLGNGNHELFRDILADWMLKNWETWLEVELLLSEQDCREQLTLLHDVAACFNYACASAIHERLSEGLVEDTAEGLGRFVLRTYVF